MPPDAAGSLRGVRVAPHRPSERLARRRTWDETLRVRFPGLFHRIGAVALRIRPRSRLRQSLLARLIARTYAAANRGDFELVLTYNDPDLYEYHPSADLLPPHFEPVYRGHEGYREFWRNWLEAFEDNRWDPQEIVDFGEKCVVTALQSGHGSGSGVAVNQSIFQLFTLRDGLVIRQQDFVDRSQALVAAGRPS